MVSDRSSGGTIETETDGYVGRITLDRPDSMNTFSTELAAELDAALRSHENDETVRAVVIDGAGSAFSAGIDLTEHTEYDDEAAYEEWVAGMEEPFVTISEMGTPVIAAAHGHAAANGLGLVAACDLAVAATGTMFGATAPKVGLFCMGPAVPLMDAVVRKRCLELLLTGELIDAETAREWGLINKVTPAGEHLEAATEYAETIASKSPTAIRRGKEAYYEMEGMGYAAALEHSNEQFAKLCTTADAGAGIEAFLDGDPLDADEWPNA